MKRPWSKFFWRDWQGDIRLRGCSLAARGLWMEMLAIMAQSDRYGYLATNGKPIAHDQLARLIGADNDTVKGLVDELIAAGVPSIEGDVLYSRRMVREMEKHLAAVDSGKLGGNPRLLNQTSEARSQKPEAREHDKAPLKPTLKAQKPFVKPTAEQVGEYGNTIGFPIDGNEFCDFYESKGWKIGKEPMKSWQAAVRTWKRRRAGEVDRKPRPGGAMYDN